MKPSIALLLMCAALLAQPEPPLTITAGGKTYTNVTVTGVTPSGLRVVHDGGAGMIAFALLPADLQKKYGYDPEKAAAHDAAMKAEQARALADLDKQRAAARVAAGVAGVGENPQRQKIAVVLKVVQVVKGGALCEWSHVTRVQGNARYSLGKHMSGFSTHYVVEEADEKMIFVTGLPTVVDGSTVPGYISPVGTYQYSDIRGAGRTVYRCEFTPAPKQ